VVGHLSTTRRYGAGVTTPVRRPATPAEARALAHPVRQRIVRLCGIRERTNKELADQLERDPATVLHHVRTLIAAGFLEACDERVGPSGAIEKPYRSTGISWSLSLDEHRVGHPEVAMLDATREEVLRSGPDAVETSARLVVRLTDSQLSTFVDRLRALVDEVVEEAGPLDDGRLPAYGALVLVHRFPDDPAPGPEAPAGPDGPTDARREAAT
jgi:hypothetical protein